MSDITDAAGVPRVWDRGLGIKSRKGERQRETAPAPALAPATTAVDPARVPRVWDTRHDCDVTGEGENTSQSPTRVITTAQDTFRKQTQILE